MAAITALLDGRRRGTHYTDRMHRILDVCHRFGLVYHDERVTYRNGVTDTKRVQDIEPVREVTVTPTSEKYGLRVDPRILSKVQTLAPHFAYALNLDASQVSVKVEGDTVFVRVPRPGGAAEVVDFDATLALARSTARPKLEAGMVLLGVDDAGNPLALDFRKATNTHAAVVGMTGSGKTTLLLTMVLSALQIGNVSVALFDPVGDLAPLSGHLSVWRGGLFREACDIEAGLRELAAHIGRPTQGQILAIIDELPLLIAQRPAIRDIVGRLAEAGRHIGLHLVIGAQHAIGSELGPAIMRNIPVRIVGRVDSAQAAYNAAGIAGTGAEKLPGSGAFVYVNSGMMVHFQAPLIDKDTMQTFTTHYPPRLADLVGLEADEPNTEPDETPVKDSFGPFVRPGSGEGGRPLDDIEPGIIEAIRQEHADTGKWPSKSWVYRLTKANLPTGGYNRDKALRALIAAGMPPPEVSDGK
jgi:hypothetical protein